VHQFLKDAGISADTFVKEMARLDAAWKRAARVRRR